MTDEMVGKTNQAMAAMQHDSAAALAQARARLDGWRERGQDRRDPLRFHFMAALAARIDGHGESVQRRLTARLAALTQAYVGLLNVGDMVGETLGETLGKTARSPSSSTRPLSALLADLAARSRDTGRQPTHPDLATLEYFRDLSVRLRIERQTRESLAQAPVNAGPLNSAFLAYRALALMHAQSPRYMRCFLTYLDTLACLAPPAATRPKGGRKI